MIIVKISGGLGNQIYQFALWRKLREKYPDTIIKMDVSFYKCNNVHNGFELERLFNISQKGARNANIYELLKTRCEIPLEILGKWSAAMIKPIAWSNARCRWLFTKTGLRNEIKEEIQKRTGEFETGRPEKLLDLINNIDIKKNWYIDGYWQNELYFGEVLQEVLDELKFPDFCDEKNVCLEKQIKENESVGIHVRRGDYVGSRYDILTMDYYKEAIQYIEEKTGKVFYYIFTNDTGYVEQEFSFLKNKYIVRNNIGSNSWCDMKLMSLCNYNILSNSSFSNWAGYFNRNANRIIIYPSQYSKTSMNTEKYGEGWIKFDVK